MRNQRTRHVVLGIVCVVGVAFNSTAIASFVNSVTTTDTPLELSFHTDWIDAPPAFPRGSGFSFISPNWEFGFEDAAPDFKIIDLVFDDGEGGAHRVGPHGEVVPNTFPGTTFLNYDPGDPNAQYVKIVDHGINDNDHFDLFTFDLSPIAGGIVPPGGGPPVPATRIQVDFLHLPEPASLSLLVLGGLMLARRRP